jgi:aerobic-type carbon monoxide dehydrogenase small subunit (CoxS/CutS family)/uncharacterized protein GlcG (DUF336 family)
MLTVNLEIARRLIEAVEAKAKSIHCPVNIAVVDAGGNLIAHARMDNARIGAIDIAINKAWTARAFDMDTAELGCLSQPGAPFFGVHASNGGRVMLLAGGMPLHHSAQIIGALGVSGRRRTMPNLNSTPPLIRTTNSQAPESVTTSLSVNGRVVTATHDSRMTLLDLLREELALGGTKKGCDHGQCGSCTVLIDGQRVLACLTLAAALRGRSVRSVEGVAEPDHLHPIQAAFIKHDAFQCGFCTPGHRTRARLPLRRKTVARSKGRPSPYASATAHAVQAGGS